MMNGSDSPEMVFPSMTHVARARTGPRFAGMFGSTQVPSGLARTFRFSTLTTQFSLSCANAVRAGHTASSVIASRRTRREAVVVTMGSGKARGLARRQGCVDVLSQRSKRRHAVDAPAVHHEGRTAADAADAREIEVRLDPRRVPVLP